MVTTKTSVYIAAASADSGVADVLQAYLQHQGLACVSSEGGEDTHKQMSAAHAIVLVDSYAFRDQHNNWELQYAQMLHKPLIVISLDQRVDESRSTEQFKLFDFTAPVRRDWHTLIDTIVHLTE